MKQRTVTQALKGQPTSDGAGVKLSRIFSPGQQLDPFLLLDEFNSDQAADYSGGFPPHPHRGFETVTYMLEGEMLHEDHLGNQGRLTSGSIQWMTAARGIIHSEMPQQVQGRMRGLQLWLNLPAAEKLKDPSYRDIPPEDIPVVAVTGGRVKVIAGRFVYGDAATPGAVTGISTDPLYLDISLEPGVAIEVPVTVGHTALVYVYEGTAVLGSHRVAAGRLAVLGDGEQVAIVTDEQGTNLLLLVARPLGEPVVQYGPFVMNTAEEIEQALRDYRNGRLTV